MNNPIDTVQFEAMLLVRRGYFYDGAQVDAASKIAERSAYLLLSRILLEGPMTISQLSDALGLDVSTLNRQTAAVMRSGLLERIPDPDGGIARKFRVTPEGIRRIEAHRVANNESLGRVFQHWSEAEVAAFAAALRRFNTDIERFEGRPWPRPEQDVLTTESGPG